MAPVPGASGAALFYVRVSRLAQQHGQVPGVLQARGDAGGLPAGAARTRQGTQARKKGGGGVTQLAFNLRVDRIVPAAPDGEAWNAAVEALAERMAAAGPLYPSALHVAAEPLGEPPQGPSAWGSLFARLRARGWRKVYAPRMSRVEARNGAEESFAWVRPA